MHADSQTFMPIHALCICMHADTLYTYLGNTHMQCHAQNILFCQHVQYLFLDFNSYLCNLSVFKFKRFDVILCVL